MGANVNLPQTDKNRDKSSVHVGTPVRQEDKPIPPFLGEDYESHWGAFSFAGKTILDIGADYGSTAYFFLQKGGKKVIAVEADPRLFNQLVSNCRDYPDIIPINLEVSQPKHFEELIEKYYPDVLKADCEGCEIHLLGVDEKILKEVPEYFIETHDRIALNAIRPRIEELFEKIGYSHTTLEVIPTVEVVHAKRKWNISTISEKDLESLKNEVSLKKQELENALASQKAHAADLENAIASQKAHAADLENALARVQDELRAAQLELDSIRSSFGYSLMRSYASRIDRAFPDGTRRGEFKEVVKGSLRIASTQGIRELFRMAFEKIKLREFRINPTALVSIESPLNTAKLIRSIPETPPKHRILVHCDTPILSLTTPTKVTDSFVISGWTISDPPVKEVKVYLGDDLLGAAEHGIVRTDIGHAYPNFPNANQSGFRKFVYVDRSRKRGICRLKIVAEVDNMPPATTEGLIEIGESTYFRPVAAVATRKSLDARASVIILTKSPPADFEETLERLRNQQGVHEPEIVIVNSGKSDFGHLTSRYGVKVYNISPQQFEHAATRNYASVKANGDYIVFMTDDAIPASDKLLHDMIEILEKDSTIGAVAARQIPRSDADLMYCQAIWGHYRMMGLERDRIVGSSELDDLPPQQKRAICQIDDVCSCFRRDVFLKYKYAPGLGYAEDLELGIRLVKDGFKIAQLFSTGVIHSHNRSPSYFLRRSYVDYKVLSKLLAYGAPQFKSAESWNDFLDLILGLVRSLDLAADDLLACQCCQYDIQEAFKMIRGDVRKAYARGAEMKTHNENLSQLLDQIAGVVGYQPGSHAASTRNPLAERYLISLGTLEEWLVNSHPDFRNIDSEFVEALYKICAVEIGNALSEFIASRTEAGYRDEKTSILERFLSEGV